MFFFLSLASAVRSSQQQPYINLINVQMLVNVLRQLYERGIISNHSF